MGRQYPECAYRFGGFLLDPAGGRLTRDGEPLKLRPQSFDVLQLLVENHGRLVTKNDLQDAVWRGRIVSDDSLVQALSDIRRALGDASAMIATVPKRGYRFDGPVQRASVAGPADARAPRTRYALSGELRIAYQVIGDGAVDLVWVPGWVTHLEYGWEEPSLARFYRAFASFSRLILFDKRGTGLSDRAAGLPTIRQRMDDVRAVMDTVGSKRAVLFGISEGAGMAITFAAAYPERTRALILYGAFAKRIWSPDYPWAPTPAERQQFFNEIERGWGGPIGIDELAPSRAHEPAFRDWWAAYQRRSASPAAALALAQMNSSIDVRDMLPKVRAPTLVMHRSGDGDTNVEEGRFIAGKIPGARFVELPGDDHLFFVGDQAQVVDCVRTFVAGLPADLPIGESSARAVGRRQ